MPSTSHPIPIPSLATCSNRKQIRHNNPTKPHATTIPPEHDMHTCEKVTSIWEKAVSLIDTLPRFEGANGFFFLLHATRC